jgi:hypothetical protein
VHGFVFKPESERRKPRKDRYDPSLRLSSFSRTAASKFCLALNGKQGIVISAFLDLLFLPAELGAVFAC